MESSSQILNPEGERLDVAFHGGEKLGVVVVLGHGVTADKDRPFLIAIANGLSERGWPCIRFSFSGNGDSEGRFEDSTITKEVGDLKSILKTVPQEQRVAYIGHSMGAAVGVKAAVECMAIQSLVSLAGMVDTSGFAEREFGDVQPDNGCMWEEPDCPLSSIFINDMAQVSDVLSEAAQVRAPWLMIHGSADDVVPIKDSRDAFDVARCEKELIEIPGADHMFGEENYPRIIDAIDGWLRKCFGE